MIELCNFADRKSMRLGKSNKNFFLWICLANCSVSIYDNLLITKYDKFYKWQGVEILTSVRHPETSCKTIISSRLIFVQFTAEKFLKDK